MTWYVLDPIGCSRPGALHQSTNHTINSKKPSMTPFHTPSHMCPVAARPGGPLLSTECDKPGAGGQELDPRNMQGPSDVQRKFSSKLQKRRHDSSELLLLYPDQDKHPQRREN